MTAVRYTVTVTDPRTHVFEVRCELLANVSGLTQFRLPSWLRGSYLVRDFAKHVFDLQASDAAGPVAIERLDKRRFQVRGNGLLALQWKVYARDNSVRKAFLDTRRGFFNGSSLFYCPVGFEDAGFEVTIEHPQDALCRDWKVATSMQAIDVDGDGFGRYRAESYEALIDHPVELCDFERHDFEVNGALHALVLSGRVSLDAKRVVADLKKICETEQALFDGEPRLPHYLFLTNVVENGYGGLEHCESTALICSRGDFPRVGDAGMSKEYRQFLGLCSHEYFHLWNVKRITAAAFLESDLGQEAYTRDLWHYEGVTSYYDDLFLLRAGVIDAASYLELLGEQATRIARTPARLVQTLEDASFETWIKYYQPDENTPNQAVSYYVKGALAALCLDLQLRRDSAITLDDVMRGLWQRYGATGTGVPEGGLEQLAQELSGLELGQYFTTALRSTEELPVAELLAEFGVQARLQPQGGEKPVAPGTGLRLKPGSTEVAYVQAGGAAEQSGLCPGDQLLALDGWKLTHANFNRRLNDSGAGATVGVTYFRDDELLQTTMVLQAPPSDTWTLSLNTDADAGQLARRKAWLGV